MSDLLVLGANAPEMQTLCSRLVRMDYRVLVAKTPDQAHGLLRDAGASIGAVIVPSDLPVVSLEAALASLRQLVPGRELQWLGAGRDPGAAGRARMRAAGVQLALFDPVDSHTLRFQVNRALAGPEEIRRRRRTVRAPADWVANIHFSGRSKSGRLYAVSASGAYVATEQPCVTRSQVVLEILLPAGQPLSASGRVAMTNVPGNMMRGCLPFGMGVQFEQLSESAAVALLVYSERRFRALEM